MREKESEAGKRPGAADQAELCGMLKRFCQKRGLEVHENANGVSGKMPNGTELFLYAVPRETAGPGPSVRIYGQTYRSDQRTRYLYKDMQRYLYDKLVKELRE